MRFFSLILFLSTNALAQTQAQAQATPPTSTTRMGVRSDCLHHFNYDKGSSQDCAAITGVYVELTHALSPQASAMVRFDPFATPIASKANTPLRADLPTVGDTELGFVADYALFWSPRPNLDFAIQSYGGATAIASVSGLGLANPFADTGWKQAAVTATYHLTALPDMMVKFAAGNGEGEIVKNLDAQQYFGFQLGVGVLKGLKLTFGASFDGNSAGSEQADWDAQRLQISCGILPSARPKLAYSTQRMGAGLAYDGSGTGLQGLQAAFGWQRAVLADLDKEHAWSPTKTSLDTCARLDPDTFFVEDPSGASANIVQRIVYDVSLRYGFLTSYFVGLDVSTRRLDTGSVTAFVPGSGSPRNSLVQTSYTGGGGVNLAAGLDFSLEYSRRQYDAKYTQFAYGDRDNKTSASDELFDARVSYNWQ